MGKRGVGGERKTGLIFLASHVYERREKTRGEEEEEWRGEGDQDVRPRLPLPASAAAQVYRRLVSHQVSVQVGQEEEDTKKDREKESHSCC